jgi:hypothetical protein
MTFASTGLHAAGIVAVNNTVALQGVGVVLRLLDGLLPIAFGAPRIRSVAHRPDAGFSHAPN